MALRAVVEPMLISERSEVTVRETRTAFRGMLDFGVMWPIRRWPGIPCEVHVRNKVDRVRQGLGE